jgi:hypothetical protein
MLRPTPQGLGEVREPLTPPYLYSGYPENAEPGPFSRELAKRPWLLAAIPAGQIRSAASALGIPKSTPYFRRRRLGESTT